MNRENFYLGWAFTGLIVILVLMNDAWPQINDPQLHTILTLTWAIIAVFGVAIIVFIPALIIIISRLLNSDIRAAKASVIEAENSKDQALFDNNEKLELSRKRMNESINNAYATQRKKVLSELAERESTLTNNENEYETKAAQLRDLILEYQTAQEIFTQEKIEFNDAQAIAKKKQFNAQKAFERTKRKFLRDAEKYANRADLAKSA